MIDRLLTMAALLLFVNAPARGSEKTIWECSTLNPESRPILYLVEWDDRTYVRFTHVRFSARYEASAEKKGFYWANEGEGYYRYGILIDGEGQAWLHDFASLDGDGLSEPLDRFSCRRSG